VQVTGRQASVKAVTKVVGPNYDIREKERKRNVLIIWSKYSENISRKCG
jgi:hypothetical protein